MVLSVNSASDGYSAAASQSTSQKSKLDYNSFLKLLVAQMKHQDPTKPMDSTEYVAQLATFSNVEQAIESNRKLDQIIQESRFSQAVGLVGKSVKSLDGLGSGVVEQVRFSQGEIIVKLSDGSELKINDQVTIGK